MMAISIAMMVVTKVYQGSKFILRGITGITTMGLQVSAPAYKTLMTRLVRI